MDEIDISISAENIYDKVGGRETLEKVHKIFYDKLYEHPWLSQFFKNIPQEDIEKQQTDFMAQAMGGPRMYCGKFPIPAHKHMYITDEMFEIRHELLKQSLLEAEVPVEEAAKWLKIDYSFKSGIAKKSIDECEKRFFTDEILTAEKP